MRSAIGPMLILAATVWAVGPASAPRTDLNQWCPVLSDEQADPEITTTYKGKTIAFCCDRCLAKFKADPEKYLSHLPQFALASGPSGPAEANVPPSPQGHEQEPVDHHHAGSGEGSAHAGDKSTGTTSQMETHGHHHPAEMPDEKPPPLPGRLHPVIVHFPVAGIPLALLGFCVWAATGREAFAKADIPPLLAAAFASVAAVVTGNIAHNSMRFSVSMHEIVERHQLFGTVTMIAILVVSAVRIWRWNRINGVWRWIYGGGLFVLAMLVGATGFLGGSLVFGPEHLKW